jgi:hypothetical protein
MIAGTLMHANTEIVGRHYPDDRRSFLEGMGQKSIENYEKFGMSVMDDFGTQDPHTI